MRLLMQASVAKTLFRRGARNLQLCQATKRSTNAGTITALLSLLFGYFCRQEGSINMRQYVNKGRLNFKGTKEILLSKSKTSGDLAQ